MANLVFWWTGWVVWGIAGAAFAVASMIAFVLGAIHAYKLGRKWNAIWNFVYMTEEERKAFNITAIYYADLTPTDVAKFNNMVREHRARLAKMSKGPVMRLECGKRYELNNGDRGKVVSAGGMDHKYIEHIEFRVDGSRETIELRADGIGVHNPALRVIRCLGDDHGD